MVPLCSLVKVLKLGIREFFSGLQPRVSEFVYLQYHIAIGLTSSYLITMVFGLSFA